MAFWKKQKSGDRKRSIVSRQREWKGRGSVKEQNLRVVKVLCITWWQMYDIMHLAKPTDVHSPRWQSRRMCVHLLLQELQNNNRIMLDPTKKMPHFQRQRRSPSKRVEGAKLCLESNPIPTSDTQKTVTNLVYTRHRKPTETEPELCLRVSSGGTGQPWTAAGSGALGAV